MSVGMSEAVANAILDAFFRSITWSEPAEIWIKLHNSDPGSAGLNGAASETTRKQASFTPASFGYTETNTDLDWINVAATETYTHWSGWTASSGGTFVVSDQFGSPINVNSGQDFSILAGDIAFELVNIAS